MKIGPPPHVDLANEIKVQKGVRNLIRAGLVKSAHDCSEGGLAVALAECCFNPERLFGAQINLNVGDTPAAAVLFNESQSRILISIAPPDLKKVISILRKAGTPFVQLGKVDTEEFCIHAADEMFRWQITDLYDDWWNAIRRAVESETERIPSL